MRIAMLPSSFLPVPNVEGGAVEYLCTELIERNEKDETSVFFDVYTKQSEKLNNISYKKTNIIQIKIPLTITLYCRIYNMIHKIFKMKKRMEPHNIALIRKYLRDGYDYVLIENAMNLYKDIYEKTKYKNNLIFHMHNDFDGVNFTEDLAKLVSKTAQSIIHISNYMADIYNKKAPNNKTSVLYNCINTERFNPNLYNKDEIRAKYGINKDDIVIMFSGRIAEVKGVRELVHAFTKIKKDNLKLMVVGSCWYNIRDDSPYLREIKQLSEEIKERIIFTGYVPYEDMPEVYAVADILAVPSMWEEPFGLVITEGMAMKLPIIATKSGAIPELLYDGGGILVDKDNYLIENLSKAIQKLSDDRELRLSMSEKNYMHLLKDLKVDSKDYFKKFYGILESIE